MCLVRRGGLEVAIKGIVNDADREALVIGQAEGDRDVGMAVDKIYSPVCCRIAFNIFIANDYGDGKERRNTHGMDRR